MNNRSSAMRAMVCRLFGSREVEGQALVEYTLIILLVVIACLGALSTTASTIRDQLWTVIAAMP